MFKNAQEMLDIDMSLFLAVFIITFCATEFSAGFLSVMSFPIQVLNALIYCTSIAEELLYTCRVTLSILNLRCF